METRAGGLLSSIKHRLNTTLVTLTTFDGCSWGRDGGGDSQCRGVRGKTRLKKLAGEDSVAGRGANSRACLSYCRSQ
jgi:hypothetical protein